MNYFSKHIKNNHLKTRGFVLPFTLFICGVMLLISTSISVILQKQIYFSQIARESQAAYYAADNAIACVLSIEYTYVDATAEVPGIFPSNTTIHPAGPENRTTDYLADMSITLENINTKRIIDGHSSLAPDLNSIECAQSVVFNSSLPSNFTISSSDFSHEVAGIPETGVTSNFNMKMDVGGGEYRCAKVTVSKTATYRQIVAQGYSRCDRPDGSVERAVINETKY